MKKIISILALFAAFTAAANNPFVTGHYEEKFEPKKAYRNPYATTFYIDPAGNDITGNGSFGNPWKTLVKACNTVNTSGDIIHVNPGTYTETAQCQLSVGVSIEGDDTSTVFIKSTLTATFTSAIYLASPEGTAGNQHISMCSFDGDLTCQMGIIVSGRSNVEIYNCRFYDFFDVGIIFRGRTDFNDGPPAIYSTGNSFHHNYVWNCANIDDSYGRGCLEIGGQTGILVYNDTIIQTARATGFNGYCMKNVNQGWIRGMKVYNCWLQVNPFHCSTAGGCNNRWDFAFEFSDNQGLEFYNNRVFGSCDQNFQYKGAYPYSVYYHDNIFGWPSLNTNPSWGIILEYSTSDAKIQNNTFMNITMPFWFVPRSGDTLHRDTITNNLAYGMGTISSYDGRAVKQQGDFSNNPANGWVIDNNTFIGKTGGQGTFGIDIPLGSTAGVTNNKCRNNIVTNFSVAIHSGGGSNMSNIYINNNLTDNVTTVISLGGTPTGVYSTTGNISANPDLNSTTYAPNVGSPAINAGTDGTDIGYTGGGGDAPPVVNSVTPANGSTGQSISVHPTATFSEDLNPATVNTTNVTMTQGGSPVTISVSYSAGVITITPASNLSYNTTYTVTLGTGITDAGGTALASPYTYSFTTATNTAPTVSSTNPANSATGVSISIHPTGTFDQPLNAATVTTGNVTMTQGGSPVTISVGYASNVITVTPALPLAYGTNYTITYGTGITNAGGTALASPYAFSFTTTAAPSSGNFSVRQKQRLIFN